MKVLRSSRIAWLFGLLLVALWQRIISTSSLSFSAKLEMSIYIFMYMFFLCTFEFLRINFEEESHAGSS